MFSKLSKAVNYIVDKIKNLHVAHTAKNDSLYAELELFIWFDSLVELYQIEDIDDCDKIESFFLTHPDNFKSLIYLQCACKIAIPTAKTERDFALYFSNPQNRKRVINNIYYKQFTVANNSNGISMKDKA